MSGLDELFSRLKAQQASKQQQQEQAFRQPSVSSPLLSPPAHTPNPIHSSNIISPVNPASTMGTPAPEQEQTNNLLNLLKFNNAPTSQAQSPMANLQNIGGGVARSGSMNLPHSSSSRPVADLSRKPSAPGMMPSPMAAAGAERQSVTSPTGNPQDFLLNLLRKPNSAASPAPAPAAASHSNTAASGTGDVEIDKLARSFAETSLPPSQPRDSAVADGNTAPEPVIEAPQPSKPTIFNYVNPFEQLHSSSPLNRSPKPPAQAEPKKMEILKHDRATSSNVNGDVDAPAAKHRKLESPSPKPVEAEKNQSVSAALEEAGEKVDEQVKQALADATAQQKSSKSTMSSGEKAGVDKTTAKTDESTIKKEAADDNVESSWESAEEEEAEKDANAAVEVYNFPMKPFVQIQIKSTRAPHQIQHGQDVIKVTKSKKEFDQMDRCLASATQHHIAYGQSRSKKSPSLGLRIIRQDNGLHKEVFHNVDERVFNVQFCSAADASNDVETVLGTGVNGSVFWASLAKSRGDLFMDDDVEKSGFYMPPIQTAEEIATGSPVKTRAKMSSRHPEYFAIARGKQIHIIAPDAVVDKRYCNSKTRKTISDWYHQEHSLKILTGKAGKDFCFSEDDTVIVSLDKSGRFKFWDIRELTRRACDINIDKHDPIELTEPIWSLNAAASGSRPEEKPSMSSIMFLDKERPVSKGIALRYVLIGFKQNHILQLWDLGLGKAVQEIRLPHEKDSDGICSITYHPKTGIVAIGHPTRNSIYFVHLSAPKYNVPAMEQSRYISALANNEGGLPRPESTAIMSGLREFSFAKIGQLRSLDMLRTPVPNGFEGDDADATLFELYVMHSDGVVGWNVKRKHLGWDKDSKMVKPVDALQAGVIQVQELIQPHKLPPPSEQSSNADTSARQVSKATPKKPEPAKTSSTPTAKPEAAKKEPASVANGASRPAQQAGTKQVPEAPLPSQPTPSNPAIITAESYAMAAQRSKSPAVEQAVQDAATAANRAVKSPESATYAPHISSADDFQAMLTKQFDNLYQRVDADKRVQDAAGAAKQDAMLRLVSSTLTENVEKSLNRIISENIVKDVIPQLATAAGQAVDKKLGESLPAQISTSVTREIKAALPGAVQKTLQDASVSRAISEQVVPKVEQQISSLIKQLVPGMVTDATQKLKTDLERRQVQQLNDAEVRRQQDNAKIQELSNLVRSLSETVHHMSQSQGAFQEQILKTQREMAKPSPAKEPPPAPVETKPEPKDEEIESITRALQEGQYDNATIQVRNS